jgi:hypothetical protein
MCMYKGRDISYKTLVEIIKNVNFEQYVGCLREHYNNKEKVHKCMHIKVTVIAKLS